VNTKKNILTGLSVLLLLILSVPSSQAQSGSGPLVIIHGLPDTTTTPPEVRTHLSVVDPETGRSINRLTVDNFLLREANTNVESIKVSQQTVGLAIVVVIDRRAISGPGDARLQIGRAHV